MDRETRRLEQALYANHRRFLEAQRGPLTRRTGYDVIAGDIPAFQIAMLHDAAALAEAARTSATLFAPPWARIEDGAAAGPPIYELVHKILTRPTSPETRPELTVERAASEQDIVAFTQVQSAGFADTEADVQSLYDWFLPKNLRASRETDQSFWILRRDGAVVSVLATVDSREAIGIYAVATPPALRRQGLSSHLLRYACARLGKQAAAPICLQVVRGSEAERLYAKLGFEECFAVNVHQSRLCTV